MHACARESNNTRFSSRSASSDFRARNCISPALINRSNKRTHEVSRLKLQVELRLPLVENATLNNTSFGFIQRALPAFDPISVDGVLRQIELIEGLFEAQL